MFVGPKDAILGYMVGVVDVLHQDVLRVTLNELPLAVSLSTGTGPSEAHPGVFSFFFLLKYGDRGSQSVFLAFVTLLLPLKEATFLKKGKMTFS